MKFKSSITYFLGTLLLLPLQAAYSYGEGICYNPGKGDRVAVNCVDVSNTCRSDRLSKSELARCQKEALRVGLRNIARTAVNNENSRNLVHTDATYFLAQLIGFTPWEAYQIAIYNEATDQVQYLPLDQKGKPLLTRKEIKQCDAKWNNDSPKCLLMSRQLNGLNRMNVKSGGKWLHFQLRYSPNQTPPPALPYPTNYLSSKNAKYDPSLANLNYWTYNKRSNACTFGITKNMKSPLSSACASSKNKVTTDTSLLAQGSGAVNYTSTTPLGELVLNNEAGSNKVLANNSSLAAYLSPNHELKYAKLGIYLHVLGDRYSHHTCSDKSYIYEVSDGDYMSVFPDPACNEATHLLMHAWEQGTPQRPLKVEHKTLQFGLAMTYNELVKFAKKDKVNINRKANKDKAIAQLVNVLEITNPNERLSAMTSLIESYRLLPLPGYGSAADMSAEEWLKAAGYTPNK